MIGCAFPFAIFRSTRPRLTFFKDEQIIYYCVFAGDAVMEGWGFQPLHVLLLVLSCFAYEVQEPKQTLRSDQEVTY